MKGSDNTIHKTRLFEFHRSSAVFFAVNDFINKNKQRRLHFFYFKSRSRSFSSGAKISPEIRLFVEVVIIDH